MPIAANLFPNPLLAACTAPQKAWHKGQKEMAHLVFFAPCRVTIRRICKKLAVYHAVIQSACTATAVFFGEDYQLLERTYKLFFMSFRGLVTQSSHILNIFFTFLVKVTSKSFYRDYWAPLWKSMWISRINHVFLLHMSSIVVVN